jgi:hypothetical protein
MRYHCRNCGSRIPKRVGRVAGDNDDCTEACPACATAVSGDDDRTTWTAALREHARMRGTSRPAGRL